jgi:hypothetical protein
VALAARTHGSAPIRRNTQGPAAMRISMGFSGLLFERLAGKRSPLRFQTETLPGFP